MSYYVCRGAKLKCSMGSKQSDLDVVHLAEPALLCKEPMANIMDSKPMVNIKPFGKCKSLAAPCIPNTTTPWLNGKTNVLVKGNPALLDTGKCMCMWAGVIEITDPGQKTVKLS